jgi:signal transduction histidine kinase
MPQEFSILIVEDDEDARSNMTDILALDGYQIKTAAHCMPAIELVESQHFDAVIVDWRLPDGNGADLIPVFKRKLPDTPVVVVTGVREFDTAVTALRIGAYDFLTKPINPDALRSLLSRLVERKKHLQEIELAQNRMMANERLAAVGQMVAGLAHESRNAFQRSHACLAELSLDLQAMPDSLKLVQKVQKALDDVNCLLEEVRQYSAPIILERRDCNLISLVQESWQQIEDAGSISKGATVAIEADRTIPDTIFADPRKLIQVFRNLLENAIFENKGNEPIAVDCKLVRPKRRLSDAVVAVSISDNGSGVGERYRDEIFAPFFTTKTKGTGLGLAICKRIVDAHDGELSVSDSQSGGAMFSVILPVIQKK